MRILVIDDDAMAGEFTAAVLEHLGHSALLANSAQAGLAALAEQPRPEAIVCDLHMPDVSGLALFRQLRAAGVDLPFIVLSADDPQAVLRQEGALDGVVLKDADMAEQMQAVLAAVAERRPSLAAGRQP